MKNCFFWGNVFWEIDRMAILAYFYGPVGVILASNVVFFVLTALRLRQAQKDSALVTRNEHNKNKSVDRLLILSPVELIYTASLTFSLSTSSQPLTFIFFHFLSCVLAVDRLCSYLVILSLFLLMGLTWITEIVTWLMEGLERSTYYAIPTDLLNIFSGLFIFVIFVLLKKKVPNDGTVVNQSGRRCNERNDCATGAPAVAPEDDAAHRQRHDAAVDQRPRRHPLDVGQLAHPLNPCWWGPGPPSSPGPGSCLQCSSVFYRAIVVCPRFSRLIEWIRKIINNLTSPTTAISAASSTMDYETYFSSESVIFSTKRLQ